MKKNISIYRASAEHGFSLVELMVAMLIGIIISIGVVQIFGATRATYQLDEGLARAQENGRFALEFLTQDIRHAGYLGCNRDTTRIPVNFLATPLAQRLPIAGVTAFEYNISPTGVNDTYSTTTNPTNTSTGWAPAPSATFPVSGALPGTDVIAVQRMVVNNWTLVSPFIDLDNVYLDPTYANKVKVGDTLMVADCQQAAAFMVTDITPTGVIGHTAGGATNRCGRWEANLTGSTNAATAQCTNVFDNPVPSAVIGAIETVVYYVANDPAADPTNPRPTLYKNVIPPSGVAGIPQPLVEGVENFQVLYGVDDGTSDSIADRYVPANGVSDFTRVVSVQIGILVYGVNATGTATGDAIDTDIQVVAGTNIVPPNDRRKRRAFNTTIQLRNRGF
jgi:type IV pilus assembly protein PilW